jgi:beta-galactosidase
MQRWSTRAGGRFEADNLLGFSAHGGVIIGVGNGNPTSIEPDAAADRRAFNGLAQAILRVGASAGPVTAAVSSPGLKSDQVRIVAVPSNPGGRS